ncbi:MAG: hypothetical protein ACOCZK_02720 [Planctomycetota bacterium]
MLASALAAGAAAAEDESDAQATDTSATAPASTLGRAGRWLRDNVEVSVGLALQRESLTVESIDDHRSAELANAFRPAPYVSVGLANTYFGESRFGWSVAFGWARFALDQQIVDGRTVDLDTESEGDYFHVTPVLNYTFGSRQILDHGGRSLQLGMGVGVGRLNVDGEAIDTTGERFRFDTDHGADPVTISYAMYLEGRINHWFLRLEVAGPVADDDSYEYGFQALRVGMGYTLTF